MRVFILLALLISNFVSAEESKQEKDARQRIMEERRQIEKFLNDSFEKSFSKKFHDLLDSYYDDSMDDFFSDDNFSQFFKDWDPFQNMTMGETHWLETPKERILILKADLVEGQPLDIKIEKSFIHISGKVHKGKRVVSFKKVLPIPDDCDGTKARIEQEDKNVLVKIPKKKKPLGPKKLPPVKPDRRPLNPEQGDITI